MIAVLSVPVCKLSLLKLNNKAIWFLDYIYSIDPSVEGYVLLKLDTNSVELISLNMHTFCKVNAPFIITRVMTDSLD
jgi:hypothetical protein